MTPQLLALHNELRSKLHNPDKSAYFPHMSFIYGDFSTEVKFNIAKQVRLGNTLLLDKIVIVRADGDMPSDWTNVVEFELN